MITINLLPQEYRKKERTPLVMLLPIFAGVACVFSAFAFAAYVHFVWRAEVETVQNLLTRETASIAAAAVVFVVEWRCRPTCPMTQAPVDQLFPTGTDHSGGQLREA